jgi:hypothetical protein
MAPRLAEVGKELSVPVSLAPRRMCEVYFENVSPFWKYEAKSSSLSRVTGKCFTRSP